MFVYVAGVYCHMNKNRSNAHVLFALLYFDNIKHPTKHHRQTIHKYKKIDFRERKRGERERVAKCMAQPVRPVGSCR